jgi:hypothetical protein
VPWARGEKNHSDMRGSGVSALKSVRATCVDML